MTSVGSHTSVAESRVHFQGISHPCLTSTPSTRTAGPVSKGTFAILFTELAMINKFSYRRSQSWPDERCWLMI